MKDNKTQQKRRGRPPGSTNQQKVTSFQVGIPKQLAVKIENLSTQTGVSQDRIALCALVDGLRNWEGVHETLINYNRSVDTLIRESGTPVKKRATTLKTDGENVSSAEKEREREIEAELLDLGPSKLGGGATHLSPDDSSLIGRSEPGEGDGVGQEFNAAIHGD